MLFIEIHLLEISVNIVLLNSDIKSISDTRLVISTTSNNNNCNNNNVFHYRLRSIINIQC